MQSPRALDKHSIIYESHLFSQPKVSPWRLAYTEEKYEEICDFTWFLVISLLELVLCHIKYLSSKNYQKTFSFLRFWRVQFHMPLSATVAFGCGELQTEKSNDVLDV